MDQVVLEAIVGELGPVLTGRAVADVVQIDAHRFLIRFDDPPFPRLLIAVHPALSTLHLVRGVKAPSSPTELAADLSRELSGRRVTEIASPPGERIVRIRFGPDRVIVAELMGKASNLLLLDGRERILRFARTHRGTFRRPAAGDPYEPPPAPGRHGAPAGATGEADVRRIAGAAAGQGLAEVLGSGLPGLSLHLAREIEHRVLSGEDPWAAYRHCVARASRDREPVLYSPGPPADLDESVLLDSRNLFAFVHPLDHAAPRLTATPMPSVNEAEAAATERLVGHMACAAIRQSLLSMLRRERRKSGDLVTTLGAELDAAREAATRDRRRGELILAGLPAARKEGGMVRVTDHYDPGGRIVEIPIDARLDLRQNADRYFRSARRADRALEIIPPRIDRLKARIEAIAAGVVRIEGARSRRDLEAIEDGLRQEGLIRAFRKEQRPEVGRRPEYVRVRQYSTGDGFTVLVGKTGAENDNLTFRVASPDDLWLHAAGWPGAHVVVRNPRRLGALPETTVLEAAAIAAWFSRAKTEGQVDVHVAWRRHVRKGRGMSPGMVMLKRHRTVRVAPALPRGEGGPH